jgi:uncharacterized protein YrzB (UPF0473 family)
MGARVPDYEPDYLTLLDEDGRETVFEVLDVVPYGADDYVVLFPAGGGDSAVILRILPAKANEEEQYVGVEDDDTLNAVFAAFRERHKEELGL